ncbi:MULTISPECIES: hypothetical protein [unclassified Streptomyces]|uniref:hypothetical protein n=1 Tax=unclassified Streptomyces TaxID=2593676 RepID=UPI002E166C8C|nr:MULTISPECIES: hypothetical protein [unclassified Streptomyces]WSR21244.1 hypothetical protein OG573_20345 [Streptomyces sp. NBC_01205]
MASNRSIRVISAVASFPFAVALFAGVARADNGAGAGISSHAAVAEIFGSGVAGANLGNSSTTQQVATGSGASNQSNGSQSNGASFTATGQSNDSFVFHPAP